MTIEELRTYFRTAKDFAKIGNPANIPVVTASIAAISDYIKEVYKTASALDRAKCRLQFESFEIGKQEVGGGPRVGMAE